MEPQRERAFGMGGSLLVLVGAEQWLGVAAAGLLLPGSRRSSALGTRGGLLVSIGTEQYLGVAAAELLRRCGRSGGMLACAAASLFGLEQRNGWVLLLLCCCRGAAEGAARWAREAASWFLDWSGATAGRCCC